MRTILLLLVLNFPLVAQDLGIPDVIKPIGGYARLKPDTTANWVVYRAVGHELHPVPSDFLGDPRWFLVATPANTPKGSYRYWAIGDVDGKPVEEEFVVQVGEAPPGPDPDPKPGPKPGPAPTDPVAKISYDAALKLIPAAIRTAPGVVGVYRLHMQRAKDAAPGYATVDQIQKILQADRALAQGDPAMWAPWNEAREAEWNRLWMAKEIQTKADVIKFNLSIADGLEAAIRVARWRP